MSAVFTFLYTKFIDMADCRVGRRGGAATNPSHTSIVAHKKAATAAADHRIFWLPVSAKKARIQLL
jgi:hypothetical protein